MQVHSAEFWRGCLYASQGMPCATEYYQRLLAEADKLSPQSSAK